MPSQASCLSWLPESVAGILIHKRSTGDNLKYNKLYHTKYTAMNIISEHSLLDFNKGSARPGNRTPHIFLHPRNNPHRDILRPVSAGQEALSSHSMRAS